MSNIEDRMENLQKLTKNEIQNQVTSLKEDIITSLKADINSVVDARNRELEDRKRRELNLTIFNLQKHNLGNGRIIKELTTVTY